MKEKQDQALKREQEEKARKKQLELEEALKKKSDQPISDNVCNNKHI